MRSAYFVLFGQMKELFDKIIDTGIQHGTVTIRMGGCSYETTTFRIDGEYEDNRHPSNVEFTSFLSEDLKRRDFTINAMAYSPRVLLFPPSLVHAQFHPTPEEILL